MKKTHNKLTCLFGHHSYSDEVTKDELRASTHLCKICGSGYWKFPDGHQRWTDYNKEGRPIHDKHSDGSEYWRGNDDRWVRKKPKNWKYDE